MSHFIEENKWAGRLIYLHHTRYILFDLQCKLIKAQMEQHGNVHTLNKEGSKFSLWLLKLKDLQH